MILDVLAFVLVGLVAFNWLVAYLLVKADDEPRNPALHERATSQVILAIVATAWGALGLVRLGVLPSMGELALVLIAGAALLTSVPAMRWLYMYWRQLG